MIIHILLTILKLLGILLLIVLGLVLLALLLVLFCPVTYQGELKKDQKQLSASARVGWLFRLLVVCVSMQGGDVRTDIRICGVSLKRMKKSFGRRKKKKAKAAAEKSESQAVKSKEKATAESTEKAPEKTLAESTEKALAGGTEKAPEKASEKALALAEGTEKAPEKALAEGTEKAPEKALAEGTKRAPEKTPEKEALAVSKTPERGIQQKKAAASDPGQKETAEPAKAEEKAEEEPFFVFRLIRRLWQGIRRKAAGIREKVSLLRKKAVSLKQLLMQEEIWAALRLILHYSGKTIRHILPKTIRGYLHFGFSDPALTGLCLGGISMLYPLTQDKLVAEPDFQHKIFESDLEIKGRLYGVFALYVFLKVYFNKSVKYCIKRFKNKEA